MRAKAYLWRSARTRLAGRLVCCRRGTQGLPRCAEGIAPRPLEYRGDGGVNCWGVLGDSLWAVVSHPGLPRAATVGGDDEAATMGQDGLTARRKKKARE